MIVSYELLHWNCHWHLYKHWMLCWLFADVVFDVTPWFCFDFVFHLIRHHRLISVFFTKTINFVLTSHTDKLTRGLDKEKLKLSELLHGKFSGSSTFNGTWISDTEIAFIDKERNFVLFDVAANKSHILVYGNVMVSMADWIGGAKPNTFQVRWCGGCVSGNGIGCELINIHCMPHNQSNQIVIFVFFRNQMKWVELFCHQIVITCSLLVI